MLKVTEPFLGLLIDSNFVQACQKVVIHIYMVYMLHKNDLAIGSFSKALKKTLFRQWEVINYNMFQQDYGSLWALMRCFLRSSTTKWKNDGLGSYHLQWQTGLLNFLHLFHHFVHVFCLKIYWNWAKCIWHCNYHALLVKVNR